MKNHAVLQKYAGIRDAGRVAYQTGSVKAFPGFSESLKKRVCMMLRFNPEASRFIEALNLELVWSHPSFFTFLVAGRDFPLHATLLEGESSEEVTSFSGALDSVRNCVVDELLGRKIVFDQFIADAGGSVILAATEIPEYVVKARMVVADYYTSEKLRVLPLDNILHSTQVRITRLPGDEEVERRGLASFHRRVEEINARLERAPINARVESVGLAQAYAFLKSQLK
ncbi:MAG: hypothetical protein Q7R65_04380 [bacterium]|nr:hypothetical protein [bacterium]